MIQTHERGVYLSIGKHILARQKICENLRSNRSQSFRAINELKNSETGQEYVNVTLIRRGKEEIRISKRVGQNVDKI